MADIKEIVDEFQLIAIGDTTDDNSTGQVGINDFEYTFIANTNEKRDRQYPLLLLDRTHPFAYPEGFNNKKRLYSLSFYVLDLYSKSSQKDIDRQTKKSSLEDLAEQFLRQFFDRSIGQTADSATTQDWFLVQDSILVEHTDRLLNDTLIGVMVTVDVMVFTDCDKGTFNF